MSSRRDFLRALGLGTGMIAVPGFGRWYRQGSGLLVPAQDDNPWVTPPADRIIYRRVQYPEPHWDLIGVLREAVT